jgi:hypothetical protein
LLTPILHAVDFAVDEDQVATEAVLLAIEIAAIWH